MMGSFITRALVMFFGYTYPAYECFKTIEKNKQEIEQLRFWCQYWILVAVLTVFERIGDTFISWFPMYGEAKLAFFVYLWYPKTKGTTYVFDTFLRPYVAKHENEIDRSLLELRARTGDIAFMCWEKAASFGQTRIFDVMQLITSQPPKPHVSQTSTVVHQSPATEKLQLPKETRTQHLASQKPQLVAQKRSQPSSSQKHQALAESRPQDSASQAPQLSPEGHPQPLASKKPQLPPESRPHYLASKKAQLPIESPSQSPAIESTVQKQQPPGPPQEALPKAVGPVQNTVPVASTSQPTTAPTREEQAIESEPVTTENATQGVGMEEALHLTRTRLRKLRS